MNGMNSFGAEPLPRMSNLVFGVFKGQTAHEICPIQTPIGNLRSEV